MDPAALDDHLKIWRYIDFAKLASMLSTQSLYFTCPTQFLDPYEGVMPRSHEGAWAKVMQDLLDALLAVRKQFATQAIPPGSEELCRRSLQALDDSINQMRRSPLRQAISKFGVCCWHENEHESDAMWKLYSASGQGIAIESSIGQLRACFGTGVHPQIDRVRARTFSNSSWLNLPSSCST